MTDLPSSAAVADAVDQICDTFEQSWRAGQRPRLEDYLGRAEEALRPRLWAELLLAELECRRCLCEAPTLQEYLERFPDRREDLEQFFRDATPPHPGPAGPTPLSAAPGGQVGGYELLQEIARGGMGVVYQARQVALNRVVALKMIRAGQLASGDEVQRFRLEAEAAASLDHPHIVPIYEVGSHQGQHYLAMKLMDGGSLAQHLPRYHADFPAAAGLVEAAARAVHHAHQHGILHRDLKPANILLDGQGQPHVTDFGLAKRLEESAGPTQSGAIVGTPSYMAPEQAAGTSKGLTTAADVYALGAILYELLTGRPPFRGETVLATLQQVRFEEPVPPRRLQPTVPRDLETICLKCLHKEAGQRYPSAEALAEDLKRWRCGEPITARPAGPVERAVKWVKRRPAVAAMLATIVLIPATAFGVVSWQLHRTSQALDQAEANLAARDVAQARSHWVANEIDKAREFLAQVPARHRDRDWRNLHRVAHAELFRWDSKLPLKWMNWRPHTDDVVAWTEDGTVALFDTRTGALRKQFPPWCPSAELKRTKLYAAPDGQRLWILRPGLRDDPQQLHRQTQLLGLDLRDDKPKPLRSFPFAPSGVVLSPDGRRLALHANKGGSLAEVELWEVATGERRAFGLVKTSGVPGLVFSPDGKRLARVLNTPSGSELEVWDLAGPRLLCTFPSPTAEGLPQPNVFGFAPQFSPDSKQVAYKIIDISVKRQSVHVWDLEAAKTILTVSCDLVGGGATTPAVFSPDGKRLAWTGDRLQIHLSDIVTGAEILTLRGHTHFLTGLAFSPDGRRLASCGQDRTLRIWDLTPPQ